MLNEVGEVFSDQDNMLLLAPPTEDEVKKVLSSSNLLAAPGIDGIPGLVYSERWDSLKVPPKNDPVGP